MKKIFGFFLSALLLVGCGGKKKSPDVSHIPVIVQIERFDTAFFAMDSNQIVASMYRLNQRFPYFFTDFTANILGIGVLNDTSKSAFADARRFLTSYTPVEDSLRMKFPRLNWLEKDLTTAFQFVKYYFPNYQLPKKIITYTGPFDAPGIAITPYALGIGLQAYAGKDFSFYNSIQGQEMYPSYISRRFEAPYIPVNCIKTLTEDLFPDKSGGRPLVEQMVDKGKYWYLTDLLLPETADSLKTGFTQKQLNWCEANEGLIWNYFLQTSNELYSIDPDIIKNYIGEAPNTSGMPEISPGNIGQWVGWQIVKKYAADHPLVTPDELMKTNAKKIFDDAKYKPR